MQDKRLFLLFGAIFGFLSVALGAFAAHGLKNTLSSQALGVFHTGVDYQAMHALALLAVGLLARQAINQALKLAGWAFVFGILIFSGSLYLLTLFNLPWLGAITPIGGSAFLLGWGALIWHIIRHP